MSILAGSIAALISYILNKIVLKEMGDIAIIVTVPLIEESSKTAMALIFKTNITAVHFIFGFIEGVYDIVNSSKNIGKWAALVSLISHTIFGLATYLVMKTGYPAYLGGLLAWILHSSWNWYVTEYL